MIIVEPYQPTDAGIVAALLNEVPEVPSTTEASFRSFTELTFNRGARDFRVARRDARLVALLTSTLLDGSEPRIRHFRVVVHPAHRRRGIGARLMAEVEWQTGGEVLQCNSQRSWAAGNAFLERHGFRVAARELLMRRSSDIPPPERATGVSIRAATPADDEAWSELHAVGYSDRDDYFPVRPEDRDAERARPGFTLVLAEAAGTTIGLCHGMHHEGDEGLVNSVVVRPEHRGRGIGGALVAAAARSLRASGCGALSLNVMANNAPAVALYERMGFAVYDEMLTFRRARRS